ncbi:KAP family P-loop NTPase fold protein [Parapedobacter indicus]|uniref:Predicted P-loop ATPase, KAP-like n=1 Tax=Parapedobacter indicus TaxID=1477437 RepID=A0A1I3IST0_9SPHI|nr:KAP family NTPase [Parapedobacter indicus]PPL02279.1 putative KAP-like P-loop ATPase [Parapedobacter indicus]SFI51011.1 Predicted P-loop ATPase, KAP-like [Parapedobacter indicus]
MSIHTDKPASLQSEDSFQRYEFAKRVASIAINEDQEKSLIIGLYGKWGEGKTTTLNFIQKELAEDVVIVNFNPWLYTDEQQLLRSFFSTMAQAIDADIKSGKEKIAAMLATYGDAIGDFAEYIPKVGSKFKWLGKVGSKLSTVSIDKLKGRVDTAIRNSGKRIVVFVDDIDRLDIHEIQYVFKLVKLVGDFPHTSYILSFDDEMVAAALSPKYGGDAEAAGYNFLEKIIQVPLRLPNATKKQLSEYSFMLISDALKAAHVSDWEQSLQDFSEIFNTAFLPFMDNPRIAIRYANTLSFSIPLLMGEVNLRDLIVVEGLKVFYPQLHSFVRANPQVFLNSKNSLNWPKQNSDSAKEDINEHLESYPRQKKRVIFELLKSLFPQLSDIYDGRNYFEETREELMKQRRICSPRYFDRYFSYTVQKGEIADGYFSRFLETIETTSVNNIVEELQNMVEQYEPFNVLLKMRMYVDGLSEDQARKLALALSEIGHNFPIEQDLNFATTYSQSANLIIKLVGNVVENQCKLIRNLILNANSLDYALEIYRNALNTNEKRNFEKPIKLDKEHKSGLEEMMVRMFRKQVTDENFFALVQNHHLWWILDWWANGTQAKYLKAFLDDHLGNFDNPDFALNLLKVFVSTTTSHSSSGESVSYKSNLRVNGYAVLKSVVDLDVLNRNLESSYGNHPYADELSNASNTDRLDDSKMVSIFQRYLEEDRGKFNQ